MRQLRCCEILTSAQIGLITTRKRSLRRLCFYRCLSVYRRGMHGRWVCVLGVCMAGGMHTWQGVSMAGACMAGGCVVGGCVVGGCVVGGCVVRGPAWHAGPTGRYYEIQSMSGRYASYWNAFLFNNKICFEIGLKLNYGSVTNECKLPGKENRHSGIFNIRLFYQLQ